MQTVTEHSNRSALVLRVEGENTLQQLLLEKSVIISATLIFFFLYELMCQIYIFFVNPSFISLKEKCCFALVEIYFHLISMGTVCWWGKVDNRIGQMNGKHKCAYQ